MATTSLPGAATAVPVGLSGRRRADLAGELLSAFLPGFICRELGL